MPATPRLHLSGTRVREIPASGERPPAGFNHADVPVRARAAQPA